ncbi:MAG: KH domain-containing protein [Ruminiclostridium sp.]|jgi:spoIIIJ-associated protein|nr:KH domain-containing protein [Ruminiclostridium sp.]
MLKWIETTGKNEDAAIQKALEELNLDRDSVSVEVLERAKSGFFGLGGSPARVKVTYEVPDEEPVSKPVKKEKKVPAKGPEQTEKPEKAAKPEKPEREKPQQPERSPKPLPKEPVQEDTDPAMPPEEVEARIQQFLSGLLQHMGQQAQITIQNRGATYLVTLEGEHLGALIGHRGDTLDAIQQLTNYAVNRGRAHRIRIHVDAENYRARREESLQRLANKVAGKVVKYRRNITLEPMNAYERHVIHEALQDYPNVITYSTGSEPNRRTVIAFSRGKHSY